MLLSSLMEGGERPPGFVTPPQVLTTDGGVIEGLFAAGGITFTVGPRYTGGGAAVGHAIIFGRVAGQEALSWQWAITGRYKRGRLVSGRPSLLCAYFEQGPFVRLPRQSLVKCC